MKKIILGVLFSYGSFAFAADVTCNGFDIKRPSNPNITQSWTMDYTGSAPFKVGSVTDGAQGTTFHHIIPLATFVNQFNSVLDKNSDAAKRNNMLGYLSTEIGNVAFQRSFNKQGVYGLIDRLKSTAASGNKIIIDKNSSVVCSNSVVGSNDWDTLEGIVAYNPANGYNGPSPDTRTWDPKDSFDTWGQYFINNTVYTNLVKLNTEQDLSAKAQELIQILNLTTSMSLMTSGANSNWVAINNTKTQRYQPRKLPLSSQSSKYFW